MSPTSVCPSSVLVRTLSSVSEQKGCQWLQHVEPCLDADSAKNKERVEPPDGLTRPVTPDPRVCPVHDAYLAGDCGEELLMPPYLRHVSEGPTATPFFVKSQTPDGNAVRMDASCAAVRRTE